MQLQELLKGFSKSASDWPFEQLIDAIEAHADFAGQFTVAAFEHGLKGGTYFDLALSHVSEPDFTRLVQLALARFENGNATDIAESVISYGSLQFPHLLHPQLEKIFRLGIDDGGFLGNEAWRGSWPGSREFLLGVIDGSSNQEDRRRAWDALLMCRAPESLRLAVDRAPSVDLQHPLTTWLHGAGFDSKLRPLFSAEGLHLVFEPGYFKDQRRRFNDRHLHPSWRQQASGRPIRFGGKAEGECGLCHGQLHHLITLPQPAISLATCISCLGWEKETLFYLHDSAGQPSSIDHGDVTPQFPSTALLETTVRLAPTEPRWRWQNWGMANSRENLFRIGGYPSWIQDSAYPDCPRCSSSMALVFQLDSDLPTEDGSDLLWGSGGICYAFWCEGCRVSALLEQHT